MKDLADRLDRLPRYAASTPWSATRDGKKVPAWLQPSANSAAPPDDGGPLFETGLMVGSGDAGRAPPMGKL